MDRNVIFKNIKRDSLVLSQTPQGFTFSKIFEKHKENINGSFDDDSSLFTLNGDKVLATRGSKENLKITDMEDLEIFRKLKKG